MNDDLPWQRATLRAHRDLSPTVREFELRPEDGVVHWRPGSHIRVRTLIAGRDETRTYSLVGLPADSVADGVYRIAVKRAEPGRGGSRYLWSLQAGDELAIGGPDNHFELPLIAAHKGVPFLLVAGGIGITPIFGMALLLAGLGADLRMRYAARSTEELVYRDLLQAALGQRLQTFADDAGERLDLAGEIASLAPGAQMLVCGPVTLLDAARDAWLRAGRPRADLRFETFGNTGRFASDGFWVEVPRHGVRIEVPADRSLLDVLGDAGIEVLSDCRRGECGLCAMDVVRVEGCIDHRDVFFSAAEKRSDKRLCACVSRVSGAGVVVLDSAWRPD